MYFCEPFRERVLEYRKTSKKTEGTLLSSLADLFHQLSVKRRKAPVKPNKFVNMLKKENEAFDNVLQHDAQEFLNFLLNHIGDTLKEEISKQEQESSFSDSSNCDHHETWVHELFQVSIQIRKSGITSMSKCSFLFSYDWTTFEGCHDKRDTLPELRVSFSEGRALFGFIRRHWAQFFHQSLP